MRCPQCGKELPDGTLFCTDCGTALSTPSAPQAPEQPNFAADATAGVGAAAGSAYAAPSSAPQATSQPYEPYQQSQYQAQPQQPYGEQPYQVQQPYQGQQYAQQPYNPQQQYGQPANQGPTPYSSFNNGDSGLSGGMKFVWLLLGLIIGLIGVLIAWLVNKDKGQKSKGDAVKFSVIGFVISLVLGIILFVAVGAFTVGAVGGMEAASTSSTTSSQSATSNGSSSSSSSAGTTAQSKGVTFDKYGGLTLGGVINNSGADIVKAIESNDPKYEYSSSYEGWLSEGDLYFTFDANDSNGWLTATAVNKVPVGATDGSVMYLISTEHYYSSFKDAYAGMVDVTAVKTIVVDSNRQIEIVKNANGDRFLVTERYDTSKATFYLAIYPESFIQNGNFNKYMEDDYGTSLDQVWKTLEETSSSSGSSTANA